MSNNKKARSVTLYVDSVSRPTDIGTIERISEIDLELNEEQIKKLLELISEDIQSNFPKAIRLRFKGHLVL